MTPARRKPAAKKSAAKKTAAKAKRKPAAKRPPSKGRPSEAKTSTPTFERPPHGLDAYWLGVWRTALKVMKDQGTWKWEQRPLLDEYVFALIAAEQARKGFKWLEHLGEIESADEIDWKVLGQIVGSLPTQWDRHTKRAEKLAHTLIITPEAQARLLKPKPAKPAAGDPPAPAVDQPQQASYFGAHLRVVND